MEVGGWVGGVDELSVLSLCLLLIQSALPPTHPPTQAPPTRARLITPYNGSRQLIPKKEEKNHPPTHPPTPQVPPTRERPITLFNV